MPKKISLYILLILNIILVIIFITSNILGTSNLLEILNDYFKGLSINAKKNFRFIHVSTDEVFGSLGKNGKFSEISPYKPNSPYAASKAAADLIVKGIEGAIAKKQVTYDFHRLMEGANKLKCSEFVHEIIKNME